MKLTIVLFVLFCLFSSSQAIGGINYVVTSISDFQSGESGGFQYNKHIPATLEDTSDALFLSSLFGLTDKINSIGVTRFIQQLLNLDGGYGNQPGSDSDLSSVRNALFCLSVLDAEPQKESVSAFIDTLYDPDTNFFSNKANGAGDVRSTAYAFECYSNLKIESKELDEKKTKVRETLQNLVRTDGLKKYFSSVTADNAYAVIAASYVGFDFGDLSAWTSYFEDRQVKEGFWKGGFYSDSERADVTVLDASLSVLALHTLQNQLVSSIDSASLISYANTLQTDLRLAASAYRAISRSRAFATLFKVEPVFSVKESQHRVIESRIIQGTSVKPLLKVRSSFGIPQALLEVSVKITFKHPSSTESKTESHQLHYNAENQIYTADEFYSTENLLGPVSFDYTIRWPGEKIELQSNNQLNIGYKSTVKYRTTHSERDVETGGVIGQGTTFKFSPSYSTVSGTIKDRQFETIFTILDSSNTIIHENTFHASKTSKQIKFDYTLTSTAIPSGVLTVKISVKDLAQNIIHTVDTFSYIITVPMVASEIKIDKTDYHIGDTVQVSMVPASLPDLRTVQIYSKHERKFFLDAKPSDSSDTLFSVGGTFDSASASYIFSFEVQPTFDSLGTHIISFRYEASNGDSVTLKLFNSTTNYLFEIGEILSYTVDSKLLIAEDLSAHDSQLEYGNEVNFTFKVLDDISKKNIWAGSKDTTAYLVLRHDQGQTSEFTSVRQAAQQISNEDGTPSHFYVEWTVNPNAMKGAAVMELVAQRADGSDVPLLNSESGRWSFNVDIGGRILVNPRSYSGKLDEEISTFFVEFELSCQDKKTKKC